MATVIKEGVCCICCTLMIANSDESGCRDYLNHDHPSVTEKDHGGYLVITDHASEIFVGPCPLCGQGEGIGYMEGHSYAVLADDHESETLGSCGCTDYHMADCPTRTANRDHYYDDHEIDAYYN